MITCPVPRVQTSHVYHAKGAALDKERLGTHLFARSLTSGSLCLYKASSACGKASDAAATGSGVLMAADFEVLSPSLCAHRFPDGRLTRRRSKTVASLIFSETSLLDKTHCFQVRPSC